jgi:hypothetical protein
MRNRGDQRRHMVANIKWIKDAKRIGLIWAKEPNNYSNPLLIVLCPIPKKTSKREDYLVVLDMIPRKRRGREDLRVWCIRAPVATIRSVQKEKLLIIIRVAVIFFIEAASLNLNGEVFVLTMSTCRETLYLHSVRYYVLPYVRELRSSSMNY